MSAVHGLIISLAVFICAEQAAAECATPPPSAAATQATLSRDNVGRAVAPVFVNGRGPFRFVVDTGANRSVLSAALATRLGINPTSSGQVHSITGVADAPFARVRTLSFGAIALGSAELPLLDGPVLGGEQGLLGFDGLSGRQLLIDFERGCVEVFDDTAPPAVNGWHRVQAQVRFGSLIVVRGVIQGVGVNVLIDTGSDSSLGNMALRASLGRVRASRVEYHGERAYTAGRPLFLDDAVWAPRINLGGVWASNVIAYTGDYHIFDLWGLQDEPTILIGVNVLAQSKAMLIDYRRGLIYFRDEPRGRWNS
jgi:predicted aspartyl protease